MQLSVNVGGHWYAGTLLSFLPHLSLLSLSLSLSLSLTHTHAHTLNHPHMQSPYQDGPQVANPSPQMLADSAEKVNDRDHTYTKNASIHVNA